MPTRRALGTMITYGFDRGHLDVDLEIAEWLGATHLEILPDWGRFPDPVALRQRIKDQGKIIWSAHGSWGGRSVQAQRVDLGNLDETVRVESVDDLKRCLDWIAEAGGVCLVVHPGGLSEPAQFAPRRDALARSLIALAEHARSPRTQICVENMPTGVSPGSRMADLSDLLIELDQPELALAIDTGHAHIVSSPADETLAAGGLLRTTHVHDNDGRRDNHLPPGLGTIAWGDWIKALDTINYQGPIMLECIRHLRERPESRDESLRKLLNTLIGTDFG